MLEQLIKAIFSAKQDTPIVVDGPHQTYDLEVQDLLNLYWPGVTELHNIKRIPGKAVYTAMYDGDEVIVKSVPYQAELEKSTQENASWVNTIGETVKVAEYIEPYVQHSDEGDDSKMVTVSQFADGVCPQCIYDNPSLWYLDEDITRTVGKYLAEFRKASQEFQANNPSVYESFPQWDTIQDGWQKLFTPVTIPTTKENFGIIHGDLHQGNMMIDPTNDWAMETIDFDNAQKGWYMVDLGTVVFEANQQMYTQLYAVTSIESYEVWFNQFKFWLTDSYAEAYGSPVVDEELVQGCQWRKDFLYNYFGYIAPYSIGDDKKYYEAYISFYESGNMPTC